MTMAAVSQSSTNPEDTSEGNANARPLAEKSSYYYAHNQVRSDSPKTLVGATEIYNHKALDAEQVAELERQASQTLESGHSSWNKGGTWEEKDYTKWAEQRLKELLPKIASPKGLVTFKEVSSIDDCHAANVFSRGKKKSVIEIEKIKLGWKVEGGEAKGKLEITEVSSSALSELHLSVKVDKAGNNQAEIDADLKACKPAILDVINAIVEELASK
mmetsp:Transcript_18108/g.59496  ORF Transcript_18108/g.59496 Transcript_18108/m.59496 type:complete len:216 (+) Transcript_18108:49-696(+)